MISSRRRAALSFAVLPATVSLMLLASQTARGANEGQQEMVDCAPHSSAADAVVACTKALSLPDITAAARTGALIIRANAYIGLSKYNLAIDDLEILQKQHYSVEVAFVLSQLYVNVGRENDAIAEATKLVDAGIANSNVFSLRGAAYQNAGRFDESIADFDKVILLNPKDLSALNNRAAAYSKKGDYPDAIKDLDAALAINPNLSMALANRCGMLAKSGHLDEGLPSCKKAENATPDDPMVMGEISGAYFYGAKYEDALRYSDRAVELMPDNPMQLYIRGVIKAKLGRTDEADADKAEAIRRKADVQVILKKQGFDY